jgi:hypothetical protein
MPDKLWTGSGVIIAWKPDLDLTDSLEYSLVLQEIMRPPAYLSWRRMFIRIPWRPVRVKKLTHEPEAVFISVGAAHCL